MYNIKKIEIMKTSKEFLTENKSEVISFYNNEISDFWTISLAEFMTDLLINFKKVTTGEDFKRFDLMGNLQNAKSRLGVFTKGFEYSEDKKTNALRAKYKGTSFMALV